MMSVTRPALAVARFARGERVVDRRQIVERDMRQDQVLLVADADLAVAVALGEVGDEVHLVGGGVARRAADRLQRDGDDGVAGDAVRHDVLVDPGVEAPDWRRGRARGRRSSPGAASSAGGAK